MVAGIDWAWSVTEPSESNQVDCPISLPILTCHQNWLWLPDWRSYHRGSQPGGHCEKQSSVSNSVFWNGVAADRQAILIPLSCSKWIGAAMTAWSWKSPCAVGNIAAIAALSLRINPAGWLATSAGTPSLIRLSNSTSAAQLGLSPSKLPSRQLSPSLKKTPTARALSFRRKQRKQLGSKGFNKELLEFVILPC